ncbi:DUF6945 domain-containing protein [Vibrio cholerae]|uniref:DUF6945 domain-containing protein n=2 Tax=Vibrio cholerae TaxID=666 RepID=A0A0H3AD22_VIBC3|nr:hypothetical protein [Vibrio cholerae]ABQ18558.1 hypothetical protein VC0395_0775 [Vibrio cholerae O395]EEY42059.1 hypothetical protein VIJ_001294 [Vibrio cholerae RC27]EGR0476265.1 hypothetical protein [Vibrio cholerae]EGR2413202.1 hypothetical protein [Vibrio cholerae]EGR2494731.1 hypothetical protein [Vibrio cholerae]
MSKFYQINTTLLESNEAVNKQTGEVVPLSPETKLVYAYMLNQYRMHRKYGNRRYTESWDKIFTVCCDVATQKQKKLAKELTTLGLIEVIGNKNAYKVVHSVESIMEAWELTNSKLNTFKDPTQTTKRKESKKQRLNKWEEDKRSKGEWKDFKEPHLEEMQDCNGAESYFTEQPPVEAYEQDYRPIAGDTVNFGVLADIDTSGAPTSDQWDCPPEDEPESPTPAKDEPQEVVEVVTPQVVEHVTPVVCGDKSKLLKCFRPNTDISEIDISGKGIGFFAKPLHLKECDKDTARQYLKAIKAYYWDQYNPDNATIANMVSWLTCSVCSNLTNELGYCLDPNCSSNNLPF